MKKLARILILVVALAMLLSACGTPAPTATTTAAATTAAAGGDTTTAAGGEATTAAASAELPRVTLKFVFGGPGYASMDEVWKNVTAVAGDRLNADFQITFYPWGEEYKQKLQLQISSGDDFDLNFDGDWLSYNTLVNQGAYLDIKDLAPQYMPEYYKYLEEQNMLKSTFVGDGMYCIPWTPLFNPRPWFSWWDANIDTPVEQDPALIKTIEDVDVYLHKVKEANPNTKYHIWESVGDYDTNTILQAKYDLAKWDFHYLTYDLKDPTAKLIPEEQTDMFKESAQFAKKWVDDGIFPRDAWTNKPAHDTLGTDLGHVFSGTAMYEYIVYEDRYKDPQRHYAQLYEDGLFVNKSPVNNLNAINKNAKNPERALMFLDLLWQDQDFYNAVLYGIEGVTYRRNDAGELLFPEGIDATTSNWMEWSSQWGFWRLGRMQPTAARSAESWALNDEFMKKPQNIVAPLAGFVPNTDSVKTEIAARDALYVEFGTLLDYGVVDDVDAALAEYIQKQKDAGLDKIIEAIQPQVDAFLAQ
ncbi:MAG: ABC transporter substrate-binding protein [Clostridiales bacterium]|jgi:putative aldouronate transport system substrate-binding protein|nr:ABC transporter substrate-binding protein [Clostridiales bacterium]